MQYADFKKIHNLDLLLLLQLGAIKYCNCIFDLNNYPDYDLSEYKKGAEQLYFFSNKLTFPDNLNTILKIDNILVRVFTNDDIERLSTEYSIPRENSIGHADFLREIQTSGNDLSGKGYEADFNGLKIHAVKISGIDNVEKTILIQGGYTSDSSWINPLDSSIILFCHILGIPKISTPDKFYINLIAEGYSLIDSGNHGLAFFIIYSAIECYINTLLNTHNKEGRLNNKLQNLFKNAFTNCDLCNHQIYTSIIRDFSNYTKIRNIIAHGKEQITIEKSDVLQLLLFTLILISSIESKISTFSELKKQIYPT